MAKATYDDLLEELKDDPEFILEGLLVEITEQLCHRMTELKVSRAELARRTGKKPTYISSILNHTKKNPTLQTLVEMAAALDMRLSCRFYDAERFVSYSGVTAYLQDKEQAIKAKPISEPFDISEPAKLSPTMLDSQFITLPIPPSVAKQIALVPVSDKCDEKPKPTHLRLAS